jgi:hypothetical protein
MSVRTALGELRAWDQKSGCYRLSKRADCDNFDFLPHYNLNNYSFYTSNTRVPSRLRDPYETQGGNTLVFQLYYYPYSKAYSVL